MDSVERGLESWLAQMPDADVGVEAARQRIGRLSRLFARVLDRVAAEQEISTGDLEALSVLKRAGGSCTPTALATELGLTSGTVSTRLRRLTNAGLVEMVDADDGRSRPVRLARAGTAKWRKATAARTAYEKDLFAVLDEAGLTTLNPLLAALLDRFEAEFGAVSRHDRMPG